MKASQEKRWYGGLSWPVRIPKGRKISDLSRKTSDSKENIKKSHTEKERVRDRDRYTEMVNKWKTAVTK